MSSQPLKIILDTDPGGDDSFALLWLLSLVKQGLAELVAITSVDGNVHARLTFAAAARLLALCRIEGLEIGRGVIGGSKGDVEDAGAIHGEDGMGNLSHTLPQPMQQYETARYADDLLIDALESAPGEITVVAIGPFTNLAAAERKRPGVLQLAKELVIMGGAFQVPGNITSEAEFNIAYDPEAAQLLFARCPNIVVLPLDVTDHIVFTPTMAAQVSQVNPDSQISQFLVALCHFMTSTAMAFRETGGVSGFLVHDAATLAYLFYPEMLRFRRAQVQIETKGDWTRGKTLLDNRHKIKVGANAWVAVGVDAPNLLAALVEDLKLLVTE